MQTNSLSFGQHTSQGFPRLRQPRFNNQCYQSNNSFLFLRQLIVLTARTVKDISVYLINRLAAAIIQQLLKIFGK